MNLNEQQIKDINKILEQSYERSLNDEGVPMSKFFVNRLQQYDNDINLDCRKDCEDKGVVGE